jgi:hypothetical protein
LKEIHVFRRCQREGRDGVWAGGGRRPGEFARVIHQGHIAKFGALEHQMPDLKARAQRFLQRPFPLGPYAEGNLTDGFIHRYVQGGPWKDPELRDLLQLCMFNALTESQSHEGEAQAYYQECVEVLQGIRAEVYGE